MDDVKIETSKTLTLTLPSDPTSNVVSVSLYHEFGSLVSGPTNATRSSAGVYTITYGQQASGIYVLNAAGRYRADFTFSPLETAKVPVTTPPPPPPPACRVAPPPPPATTM